MRNDVVTLLRQLVEIPSVYPCEQALAEFVTQYFKRLGFETTQILSAGGRPNIVASFGEATQFLAFYGHLDTVPPAADFAQDPFSVVIDGDTARGLGVADMKGGLAAILSAATWAAQARLPFKVLLGVDEEDISRGAHDLVRNGALNDVAFLIAGESGQVSNRNNAFSVGVGRKGRVVIDIDVRGKQAHAALADQGVNAISQAAKVVQIVDAIRFAEHPRLGPTQVVIQEISSATDGFSVPGHCRLRLSLLATPQVSSSAFIKVVEDRCDRAEIEVSVSYAPRETPFLESYELDQQEPFFRTLLKEVILPAGVEPELFSSVADENVFAHFADIPVLTFGPTAAGDHTRDEWVSISSLEQTFAAYCQTLKLWSEKGPTRSNSRRRSRAYPGKCSVHRRKLTLATGVKPAPLEKPFS